MARTHFFISGCPTIGGVTGLRLPVLTGLVRIHPALVRNLRPGLRAAAPASRLAGRRHLVSGRTLRDRQTDTPVLPPCYRHWKAIQITCIGDQDER